MVIDWYINKEKSNVRFVLLFFQDLFSVLTQNQCLGKNTAEAEGLRCHGMSGLRTVNQMSIIVALGICNYFIFSAKTFLWKSWSMILCNSSWKECFCRESFCFYQTKLLWDRTILIKKTVFCKCCPNEWESLHLIISLLYPKDNLVQIFLLFPYIQ